VKLTELNIGTPIPKFNVDDPIFVETMYWDSEAEKSFYDSLRSTGVVLSTATPNCWRSRYERGKITNRRFNRDYYQWEYQMVYKSEDNLPYHHLDWTLERYMPTTVNFYGGRA